MVGTPIPPADEGTPLVRDRGPSRTPLRFLVVEDEVDTRETLGVMLETQYPGCVVTMTPSAEGGLAHLQRESFDVVITDYDLPGFNGLDLVRAVARDRPGTSCVLVTGFLDQTIGANELRSGLLAGNLRKIMAPDELLRGIGAVVDRRLAAAS